MKPIRICPRISALLLILILLGAVTGCNDSAPDLTAPLPAESTSAPTQTFPDSNGVSAPTYVCDDSFDNSDMAALKQEAAIMMHQEPLVFESPSRYVRSYFTVCSQFNSNYLTWEKDRLTLNYMPTSTEGKDALEYGIFLHLLCSRYFEAICESDYDYVPGMSSLYNAELFFCPGYKEAGYETVLDCCIAIDKKTAQNVSNAYYIRFDSPSVIRRVSLENGEIVYN